MADTSTATTRARSSRRNDSYEPTGPTDSMAQRRSRRMETKTKAVLVYRRHCAEAAKCLTQNQSGPSDGADARGLNSLRRLYRTKMPRISTREPKRRGVEEARACRTRRHDQTGWLLLVDVECKRVLSQNVKPRTRRNR